MDFLIGGRQQGKTHALLKWASEAPEGEHRVIACHSHVESMRLLRQSRDAGMDLESWQFVGPMDAGNQASARSGGAGLWSGVLRGRGGEIHVGIDNIDILLTRLWTPFQVDVATGTGRLYNPLWTADGL